MQEAAITPKVRRTKRIAWGYRKLNAWKKRPKKLERQASKKETPPSWCWCLWDQVPKEGGDQRLQLPVERAREKAGMMIKQK